jgi:lipopolysaccharide export system protein LptA
LIAITLPLSSYNFPTITKIHLPIRSLAFFLGVCCFLIARASFAQSSNGEVTITADSLLYGETSGQKTQQMIGHVQFAQGTLHGSSDRAVRFLDQNKIELTGHVVIRQDTLSLLAPHVIWEANDHVGHADGGVTLLDRDVTLKSEVGDYDAFNQVAVFHKNVFITEGRTLIKSDELTYYRATETSIARGRVVVTSDSGRLHADNVIYSRALGETTAEGHVDLKNDSMHLNSDWMYDSKPQGIMFTRGHVRVESLANNTVIFGDTLARFARLSYISVPIHPLLLMIDTSTVIDSVTKLPRLNSDTLFIRSSTMEAYQGDSTRFLADDSVKLYRTGFAAIGGRLDYRETINLMTLSNAKRQRLWYDSTEVVGDSVAMLLDHRKIKQVVAVGHAFATDIVGELPGSGRVNQLQAERIHMDILRDTVRNVVAVNNALSIYFILNDGKAGGVNRSSGDSIRIDFEKKTVKRVTVLSGTEGEFFPEKYVVGRGKDFRLSGYDRALVLKPRRDAFFVPQYEAEAALKPAPSKPKDTPKRKKTS